MEAATLGRLVESVKVVGLRSYRARRPIGDVRAGLPMWRLTLIPGRHLQAGGRRIGRRTLTAVRSGLRVGAWLSLVERSVWDRDVAGSNPVAPTNSLTFVRVWSARPFWSSPNSRRPPLVGNRSKSSRPDHNFLGCIPVTWVTVKSQAAAARHRTFATPCADGRLSLAAGTNVSAHLAVDSRDVERCHLLEGMLAARCPAALPELKNRSHRETEFRDVRRA